MERLFGGREDTAEVKGRRRGEVVRLDSRQSSDLRLPSAAPTAPAVLMSPDTTANGGGRRSSRWFLTWGFMTSMTQDEVQASRHLFITGGLQGSEGRLKWDPII